MVRFLLGRSGYGKTRAVIDEIAAAAARGQDGLILLVPEQHSHAMERALCEQGGDSISLYAEVMSFRRLCRRVAEQAGGLSRTLLDDGGRLLYLYQALDRARGSFKALGPAAGRPEFLETLLGLTDQVKAAGIAPEELMERSREFDGALGDKLADLAAVCAAYQGAVEDGKLDAMDELQKLSEDVRSTGFFRGKTVWIDGFTGFTGLEYRILRLIFSQAEQTVVALCADPEDSSAAFAKANDTLGRLRAWAPRGAEMSALAENRRARGAGLAHLERELFCPGIPTAWEGQAPAVELWAAGDAYQECELAAARILQLVREQGYRFREISVSARDLDAYAPTLEAVFGYYGVPLYLSRKSPVLEKPPAALVAGALQCVSGGFRYDDMAKYLKTGLTGLRRRGLDILETYLYTWNIRGGDWSREQGFTGHPLGLGHTPDAESERTLRLVNRMRQKVRAPLVRLRDAVREDPSGEGYARALVEYMSEIRLPARLEARAALFRRRGELQAAEEYQTLWSVLCGAINSIGRVLGDRRFEPDEFTRLFRLVLSRYQVGTIPVSLDRVNAGDLSRPGSVGRVRCQIVLGAADGYLPASPNSGQLFSDSEYQLLEDAGIELAPDAERRLNEEFRLIYAAFTAPEERLIVTRPLAAAGGESLRESFVIGRLRALFPGVGTQSVTQAVRGEAPGPCFDAAACGGDAWAGAREYFAQAADWRDKLALAEKNSRVPRGPIREGENIRAVFGKDIRLSASRADVFGACRYRYFLQYGLRLRQKRAARLDAPAAGVLIHYVLERTFRQVQAEGGCRQVLPARVEALAREAGEAYGQELLGGFADKTPRFRFLFGKLCNTAVQVALDIREELAGSAFTPLDFELKLSDRDGDLPAVRLDAGGATLCLEGYVDRVDGYEKDGKLYLRVVDYKTGQRDFRLDEVLNGLNIQLLVYLFALEEQGGARYGREVLPAGVLYVPARDPEVPVSGTESPEEVASARQKLRRRRGLLLNDPELLRAMEPGLAESPRFLPVKLGKDGAPDSRSSVVSAPGLRKLGGHMQRTLQAIGEQLAHGEIRANPYYKSRTDLACSQCPYWAACLFDERCGDRARYLFQRDPKEFFEGE